MTEPTQNFTQATLEIKNVLTADTTVGATAANVIASKLEAFWASFKGTALLNEARIAEIAATIKQEYSDPIYKLPQPLSSKETSAAMVGAANFATFAMSDADAKTAITSLKNDMKAHLTEATTKVVDEKAIDAAVDAAVKAAAEAKKKAPKAPVKTLGLEEVRTKLVEMLDVEYPTDKTVGTKFGLGFDDAISTLSDPEKAAVKVPEDEIKAIYKLVYKEAIKPEANKDASAKHGHTLGYIGAVGALQCGVKEDKVREPLSKKVKDQFVKNTSAIDADDAKKEASGKYLDGVAKNAKKEQAALEKPYTMTKVSTVAIGAAIVAWFVSLFKGKEVKDKDGNPVKDEQGNVQRHSAPFWKKALVGILVVASTALAVKTTVQGKNMNEALGEMKNPLTWFQKAVESKALANAAKIGK